MENSKNFESFENFKNIKNFVNFKNFENSKFLTIGLPGAADIISDYDKGNTRKGGEGGRDYCSLLPSKIQFRICRWKNKKRPNPLLSTPKLKIGKCNNRLYVFFGSSTFGFIA